MGQKFESELARKVADGNKDNSSTKKGVLFAAVATCALLFGSAAFSIAMNDSDNGKPTTVLLLTDEVDELQAELSGDENVDVKRIMNLKAKTFSPEGDSGCADYTKIIYSVIVKINDAEAFDYAGMTVGILTIDYAFADLIGTTITVTVGEDELTDPLACVSIAPSFPDEGKTLVTISLPEADYSASSTFSFNVSVKLPVSYWGGVVTENPWPVVLGIDDPYTVDWALTPWA